MEALAVAIIAAALSLVANAVSPLGLKLSRNYFPRNTPVDPAGTNTNALPALAASTNSEAVLLERLRAKGLAPVQKAEVLALYNDPEYQAGMVLFIDARDDAAFEAGHIPGAHQLDYYRPEKHLPTVLPLTQIAREIVLYCNGGDCEDSEFAAGLLRDAGVSPEKIKVYVGGFTEWKTNNLPVEMGPRMSGNIINAN